MLTKQEVLDSLKQKNISTIDDIAEQAAAATVSKSNVATTPKEFLLEQLSNIGVSSLDDIAEKAVAAVQKADQSKIKKTQTDAVIHIDG